MSRTNHWQDLFHQHNPFSRRNCSRFMSIIMPLTLPRAAWIVVALLGAARPFYGVVLEAYDPFVFAENPSLMYLWVAYGLFLALVFVLLGKKSISFFSVTIALSLSLMPIIYLVRMVMGDLPDLYDGLGHMGVLDFMVSLLGGWLVVAVGVIQSTSSATDDAPDSYRPTHAADVFPPELLGKASMIIITYEGTKDEALQYAIMKRLVPLGASGVGFMVYCGANIANCQPEEDFCAMVRLDDSGYPRGVSLESLMIYERAAREFPPGSPGRGRVYGPHQTGYWLGVESGRKIHAVLLM